MRYFPLFFDLLDRTVLVVGGGEQAAQKVRLLLKTPARIMVVAPHLNRELAELAIAGRLEWCAEMFAPGHLDGAALVFTTLDGPANGLVAAAARARGIPVNAVDMPELCDVITPAIVDRSPVVVAIGTEGAAPVLARRIKAHLEGVLPSALGIVARSARRLRSMVASRICDPSKRRAFWEVFWSDRIEGKFLKGRHREFWQGVRELLEREGLADRGRRVGHVSLVGAGPASADLLTFRAMQRLQRADVIVYDRLIDPAVLDCARRDAKRIFVGKTPGRRCIRQDDINSILLREAGAGNQVVRLKCGDPLIFGRAGEEMDALDRAGIAYDVVPGITAATACAAEAGVPLSMRKDIRSVVLLTGHCMNGPTPYDWRSLAQPGSVLAIYMGVKMAPIVRANLLSVGAPGTSPVTIVENGCTPKSRIVQTTLRDLEKDLRRHQVSNPALIYVHMPATEHSPPLLKPTNGLIRLASGVNLQS